MIDLEYVKQLCQELDDFERLIFSHSKQFENLFCYEDELIAVYFSSRKVKLYCLNDEGATYTTTCNWEDIVNWSKTL